MDNISTNTNKLRKKPRVKIKKIKLNNFKQNCTIEITFYYAHILQGNNIFHLHKHIYVQSFDLSWLPPLIYKYKFKSHFIQNDDYG